MMIENGFKALTKDSNPDWANLYDNILYFCVLNSWCCIRCIFQKAAKIVIVVSNILIVYKGTVWSKCFFFPCENADMLWQQFFLYLK